MAALMDQGAGGGFATSLFDRMKTAVGDTVKDYGGTLLDKINSAALAVSRGAKNIESLPKRIITSPLRYTETKVSGFFSGVSKTFVWIVLGALVILIVALYAKARIER